MSKFKKGDRTVVVRNYQGRQVPAGVEVHSGMRSGDILIIDEDDDFHPFVIREGHAPERAAIWDQCLDLLPHSPPADKALEFLKTAVSEGRWDVCAREMLLAVYGLKVNEKTVVEFVPFSH